MQLAREFSAYGPSYWATIAVFVIGAVLLVWIGRRQTECAGPPAGPHPRCAHRRDIRRNTDLHADPAERFTARYRCG